MEVGVTGPLQKLVEMGDELKRFLVHPKCSLRPPGQFLVGRLRRTRQFPQTRRQVGPEDKRRSAEPGMGHEEEEEYSSGSSYYG